MAFQDYKITRPPRYIGLDRLSGVRSGWSPSPMAKAEAVWPELKETFFM